MPYTQNQRRWDRVNRAKKQAKLARIASVETLEPARKLEPTPEPNRYQRPNAAQNSSPQEDDPNVIPFKAHKFPPMGVQKQQPVKNRTRHSGPLGKAKVLTAEQFDLAQKVALERGKFGPRDQLFIMLSRFGGLRSAEIATIYFEDLTDAEGRFTGSLRLSKRGAKYGKERTVRLRGEVVERIKAYVHAARITSGPIFWTQRGDPMTPNAVQKQIKKAYLACGFKGARSHSGRRYAITTMAQNVNTIGASLEDVRIFAGHADITTTAGYIEESPHAHKLIEFL